MEDASTLTTRPAVIAIVVLFVLGVGYAIATLPRAFARVAAAPAMSSVASTDASSPADPRRAFEDAWAKQPRVDLGIPAGHARVVVVKFLDWQCPACKLTDEWYRPVLAHFETLAPGDVKYVEKDFPLDPSCNFAAGGRVHPAPCDAAAAVRLATSRGKREEMIQWNFANQRATSAAIRAEARALLGLTNVDQEFASVLRAIRQDVSDAAALRVHGTPTIFINGVECPAQALPPAYFQMAIEYELRTAGSGR
jgi:protein-disulfide isomerase